MKMKQDNDVTNCISVIYIKNKTELLWPIETSVVCHKNKIGQRHN